MSVQLLCFRKCWLMHGALDKLLFSRYATADADTEEEQQQQQPPMKTTGGVENAGPAGLGAAQGEARWVC